MSTAPGAGSPWGRLVGYLGLTPDGPPGTGGQHPGEQPAGWSRLLRRLGLALPAQPRPRHHRRKAARRRP